MKKLFVALMAVLMLASCGGDKKTGGIKDLDPNASHAEILDAVMKVEKAYAEDLKLVAKSGSSEDYVNAFVKYHNGMTVLADKYGVEAVCYDPCDMSEYEYASPTEEKRCKEKALEIYRIRESYLDFDHNVDFNFTKEESDRMEKALMEYFEVVNKNHDPRFIGG